MHETYDKALVDSLAAMIADKSVPAEARGAALETLAPLHHQRPAWDGAWWATQPAGSPPPAKTVEWEGTPIVLRAIRDGLKDTTPEIRRAAIASLEDCARSRGGAGTGRHVRPRIGRADAQGDPSRAGGLQEPGGHGRGERDPQGPSQHGSH